MPSLLSLQEADTEAVQDREAKRHGQAMLDILAKLQRGLLGGQGLGGQGLGGQGPDALQSLANLVRATPMPSDPRLASVQRAVLVRVAVELARGKMQAAAV